MNESLADGGEEVREHVACLQYLRAWKVLNKEFTAGNALGAMQAHIRAHTCRAR